MFSVFEEALAVTTVAAAVKAVPVQRPVRFLDKRQIIKQQVQMFCGLIIVLFLYRRVLNLPL